MSEYLIEVKQNGKMQVVVVQREAKTTTLTSDYKYGTKFKSKERAVAVAKKIPGANVVPSFGGYVNSTKSSVAPIGNKVNTKTAFSQTMTAYRKNQY